MDRLFVTEMEARLAELAMLADENKASPFYLVPAINQFR
jgi:hypothetical protein